VVIIRILLRISWVFCTLKSSLQIINGNFSSLSLQVTVLGETATIPNGVTTNSLLTPTITAISPSTVSVAGGTTVTVTGTGFVSDVTVSVDYTPCTDITINSPTELTCKTPSLDTGAKDVKVNAPLAGDSASFTINYILSVASVDVGSGSMAGGRGIQITGQGFGTNATVVKAMIGDYPCEVTGVSDILLEWKLNMFVNRCEIGNPRNWPLF